MHSFATHEHQTTEAADLIKRIQLPSEKPTGVEFRSACYDRGDRKLRRHNCYQIQQSIQVAQLTLIGRKKNESGQSDKTRLDEASRDPLVAATSDQVPGRSVIVLVVQSLPRCFQPVLFNVSIIFSLSSDSSNSIIIYKMKINC